MPLHVPFFFSTTNQFFCVILSVIQFSRAKHLSARSQSISDLKVVSCRAGCGGVLPKKKRRRSSEHGVQAKSRPQHVLKALLGDVCAGKDICCPAWNIASSQWKHSFGLGRPFLSRHGQLKKKKKVSQQAVKATGVSWVLAIVRKLITTLRGGFCFPPWSRSSPQLLQR